MHSWKEAGGASEFLGCLHVDHIRPPMHAHRAKVFYNTRPCTCVRVHLRNACLSVHRLTQRRSLPLWRKYTRSACARARARVPMCSFYGRNKREFRFWCAPAQKYFIMLAKIHAHIYTLCYKTDFNASRHPFCANRAGRSRATRDVDRPTLTFSFCESFADPRIYLSTVLDLRQLFIRKLCGNESRDDGYSARRFIPTCGRDMFCARARARASCAKGVFYTPVEDRISFLI